MSILLYLVIAIIALIYWLPRLFINWVDSKYEWTHFYIPDRVQSPPSWGARKTKPILLTFDDIPYDPLGESFQQILNVLDQYNHKAIFFVISSHVNHNNYKWLVRAVERGHCLANHGRTNAYHCFFGQSYLKSELEDCNSLIQQIYRDAHVLHPQINFYRPGGGIMNQTILNVCEELKMTPLLGSVYPHDPIFRFSWLNIWYIKQHLEENDIIILHDRSWTPELLSELFEWFSETDFEPISYGYLENAFESLQNETRHPYISSEKVPSRYPGYNVRF